MCVRGLDRGHAHERGEVQLDPAQFVAVAFEIAPEEVNAGAVLQLRGLTPSRDAITDFLEDAA